MVGIARKNLIYILFFCAMMFLGYLAIRPFLNGLMYNLSPASFMLTPSQSSHSLVEKANSSQSVTTYQHGSYTLIIPRIGIDTSIELENNANIALTRGAWFYPDSVQPGNNGTTFLLGHRFEYLPPNTTTFYLLDKLQQNDDVIVYWDNKEYRYKVSHEITVPAGAESQYLRQTTSAMQIGLVTCTPLWSAANRLIVYANLVS